MAKKKKTKAKKKTGRKSKYKPQYAEEAEKLCREKGYTDKNLAAHFHVSEATINNWKNEFLEFLESTQRGKYRHDSKVVVQSLLKRCKGKSYSEITQEYVPLTEENEEGEIVEVEGVMRVTKIVNKIIMPETSACMFWLKNRWPEDWSDIQKHAHDVAIRPKMTTEETMAFLKEVHESPDGIDWDSIEGKDADSDKKTS